MTEGVYLFPYSNARSFKKCAKVPIKQKGYATGWPSAMAISDRGLIEGSCHPEDGRDGSGLGTTRAISGSGI